MASWSNTVSKRLLPGRKGTVTTLRVMSRMAQASSGKPDVVKVAQDVVRQVPERDHDGEIAAMLAYVRRTMRYTRDPLGTETIKAPEVMLAEIAEYGQFVGDCDDASVLLSALLGAVGYATEFKVAGADHSRPREPSHVWVAVRHPRKGWIALDPIVRNFGVGDEMPEEHVVGSRGRIGATRGDSQMYGGLGLNYSPILIATQASMMSASAAAGAKSADDSFFSWGTLDRVSDNPLVQRVVGSAFPVRRTGAERVAILNAKRDMLAAANPATSIREMSDTTKIVIAGAAVVGIFLLMRRR